MDWRVEYTPEARFDLVRLADHLLAVYMETGDDEARGAQRVSDRVMGIADYIDGIAAYPHRGTRHPDFNPEMRSLTHNRAIVWFSLDEAAGVLRVVGVFFGGQDHRKLMIQRLSRLA